MHLYTVNAVGNVIKKRSNKRRFWGSLIQSDLNGEQPLCAKAYGMCRYRDSATSLTEKRGGGQKDQRKGQWSGRWTETKRKMGTNEPRNRQRDGWP